MEQKTMYLQDKELLDMYNSFKYEQDYGVLLQKILESAMKRTNCDAGTIYILKDNHLHFKVIKNISMKFAINLVAGKKNDEMFPPVNLSTEFASGYCVAAKRIVNIEDVHSSHYNFVGTKNYDERTGYRTKTMLNCPLVNHRDEIIGVMQLINAKDGDDVVPFRVDFHDVLEAFGVQVGICLSNILLAQENKELLDSMVTVLTTAIEQYSSFNSKHTSNMVALAERFLEWTETQKKQLVFSAQDKTQLIMSIRLHDIGKILVSKDILNKRTRLDKQFDMVMNRFERLELYTELAYFRNKITFEEKCSDLELLKEGRILVTEVNTMDEVPLEMLRKLEILGEKEFISNFDGRETVLMPKEKEAIMVPKGILTEEERYAMEKHAEFTEMLLQDIKFTKEYENVTKWAVSHHEHLNGTGYPHEIKGKDISMAVRLITIIDSFESMTAVDRPDKKPFTPESALENLRKRAKIGQLDDLMVELFAESQVWVDL